MYYLFIIHKGGRVQELECCQGGGMRQGVGWTKERSYAPTGPANDDGGNDDDSPVDNEEVVTEKPQTTWLGRGLAFFP